MKFRISKKVLAAVLLNGVSLAGVLGFTLAGSRMAKSQNHNFAAERWSSDGEYAQISCFFPEGSGFELTSVAAVRTSVLQSLKSVSIAPKESQKLCPDAYSATVGQAQVQSDINGYSEAKITAVGGDFFLIHNFSLLDGAFFTDDDIMQDGAVIDRDLAWALYGSEDIAGMNIKINGTQFYIAGVIDTPSSKEEKQCRGELPQAYISYDGASAIAMTGSMYSGDMGVEQTGFTDVSCYEVIMPDPVTNYAHTALSDIVGQWEADTVMNTGRFDSLKCLKAIKGLSRLSVREKAVAYPYWENASLIVESKLSFIYLWRILCLIAPVITLAWIAVKGAKLAKKYIVKGVKLVLDLIEKRKLKKWREKNEQKEA